MAMRHRDEDTQVMLDDEYVKRQTFGVRQRCDLAGEILPSPPLSKEGTEMPPLAKGAAQSAGGFRSIVTSVTVRTIFAFILLFLTTLTVHAGIDEWTSTGPGGGLISAIAVAPSNPDIVYAGTNGTVFKSINGGAFWTVVNNSFSGGGYPTILAVDPQNPDLVYMDYNGLSISRDGGTTWSVALEFGQIYSVAALVFDPLDHNTVYAAGAGVWKSTDAGVSWTQLATNSVAALTIYHTDAAQPAILYAVTGATNVSKSTDGGATWSASITVGPYSMVSLAVDPTNPDIVYAGDSSDLYRSADGGTTWTKIYDALNASGTKLAILPQQPSVLYAISNGAFHRLTIAANGAVQSNTFLFSTELLQI